MGPLESYAIQPAFTGGEISNDVASRIDIDKYQLALLRAENAVIRPYGAVKKRNGMIYQGEAKGKCILMPFRYSAELSYLLEIGAGYIRIWRNGTYLNVELATPFEEAVLPSLRFVQSIDVMYICSGKYPVKKLMRYGDTNWQIEDMEWSTPPFGEINNDENLKITPSATSGTITLTASSDFFTSAHIGRRIKLQQYVSTKTVNCGDGTSSAVPVGDSWKIITHGTWAGSVSIQKSDDGGITWTEYRKYTGNSDYNPTESDAVESYCLMRLKNSVSSGSVSADLSAYAYTHEGYVEVKAVADSTHATAEVVGENPLGSTDATADFYLDAWNSTDGYPKCATFFQDRLVFAGSQKYPQRVWMSQSGDYTNFSVQKESGTVTDDSAVTADLLSLQAYSITHVLAGNDLILLTEGNEWTISGSETVTPTNITPRSQQSFGANDVLPIRSGNRIVYVQRRGSIVRDMGYSYDTDSYAGMDLTLLAKHLFRGHELVGSTYAQEPDSVIYLVRDDGVLLCLTYLQDQRVYAWSHIETDGNIESVCAVSEGNNDVLYLAVRRTKNGQGIYYIERMDIDHYTANQGDYIMVDAAVINSYSTPTKNITGLDHLEGKKVSIIADGVLYEDTVENGAVILPQEVEKATVGLPYTMRLEQPNVEIQMRDGTSQGRDKTVPFVILRLANSYGGQLGPDEDHLDDIVFNLDEMELGQDMLYTGDKKITLPLGGFNQEGRIFIKHEKPYPFSLLAVIRAVTFGGTGGGQ